MHSWELLKHTRPVEQFSGSSAITSEIEDNMEVEN
jgi:hypothetical protein